VIKSCLMRASDLFGESIDVPACSPTACPVLAAYVMTDRIWLFPNIGMMV
jgi:hypothetical protein